MSRSDSGSGLKVFLMAVKRTILKALKGYRAGGFREFSVTFLSRGHDILTHYYLRLFGSAQNFMIQGKEYEYFYHYYNVTWRNERAVEIPVIWDTVKKYRGKRILEVGNVLSHYFNIHHDVLDKYEQAEGVFNQDIVEFRSPVPYDLIVSISTLEHVGWDESPRDPEKVLRALENLEDLCSPGGVIMITIPLGYNKVLDESLRTGQIKFDSQSCLKRVSEDNLWLEVNWSDVRDAKYGNPFPWANGIVIGTRVKRG